MQAQLSDLGIALLVTMGMEGVGSLLLRRRSRSIQDWNQAFLVGLSALAVIVFPLTLLSPHLTLPFMAVVVVTAAVVAIPLTIAAEADHLRKRTYSSFKPRKKSSVIWGIVIALLVLHFAVQDLFSGYVWDGYQIWTTKALILFHTGGLSASFLVPGEYNRLIDYPPLLPLYHALVASIRGGFDWAALKPGYLVIFLSLLVSIFKVARYWMTRGLALAAVAAAAALPVLASHEATGGYADMPQAALFTAAVAAALGGAVGNRDARALPWLVGGTIMVKSEGSLLATTLVACIVLAVFIRERGASGNWFRTHAGGAVIVVGSFVLRHWYLAWIRSQDTMYGPIDLRHLRRAANLGLQVPAQCLAYMLDYREWGLLWPALFVVVLFAWRSGRTQLLALGGICAIIVQFIAIFYFSNWKDVNLHIQQAYPRLLSQIAPLTVVLVVAACARELGAARGLLDESSGVFSLNGGTAQAPVSGE